MDWSKVLPAGNPPFEDKTKPDFFSTVVSSLIDEFETLVRDGTTDILGTDLDPAGGSPATVDTEETEQDSPSVLSSLTEELNERIREGIDEVIIGDPVSVKDMLVQNYSDVIKKYAADIRVESSVSEASLSQQWVEDYPNITFVDAGISGTESAPLPFPAFGGQSFVPRDNLGGEMSHPVIKQILDRVDAVEVSLEITVDELAELRDQLEGLQKLMRHVLTSLGEH